jgi:hypothetical protein
MSRWLRASAVAGCTALLYVSAGLAASPAFADTPPNPIPTAPAASPSFTLAPAYGQVGQMLTITAQGATTFPTDGTASVTFNSDVTATTIQAVSSTQLDVVVPSGATTGPVDVVAASTTYTGPTFTLQQPTSWAASLRPSALTYGQKATVGGELSSTGPVNGPVAGVLATLQFRQSGSGRWHTAGGTAARTTSGNGQVSWQVEPSRDGQYRVTFKQTPQYAAAISSALGVAVRPQITLRPVTTAPALTPTQINGTIKPRLAGPVFLEQRTGTTWKRIQRTQVHNGGFTFTINPNAYSLLRERVERPADSTHVDAISRVLAIQVVHRLLEYGDSGADVKALEQRLRALHYDVGPPSTYYGWDMVHAVTAFQKVQGFTRTGDADTDVWARLAHPKVPHLEHTDVSGTSVEVNLTSQILMIGKNGHIWRILDTSTAGGYTYTDTAGEQATAITPTGFFRIQYKIDHLVKDKLGTLWRPSYFDSSGDAIHGEGDTNSGYDVPAYPASHGCVRITDSAVDRYYNVFAIGTPVWIYYASSAKS